VFILFNHYQIARKAPLPSGRGYKDKEHTELKIIRLK